MVAPAIIAAARVLGGIVAKKVVPRALPHIRTAAKTARSVVAPKIAQITGRGPAPKAAASALKQYTQGTSKGASIAAGSRLASKIIPKSRTGKVLAAITVGPVAKDLYGRMRPSASRSSGQSLATTSRESIMGGYSEVGGVDSGEGGPMPTIGSAAQLGRIPAIAGLLKDPKVKGALVAAGLLAAGAEALGIIDVIPGVGRPKAKKRKAAKRRKPTKKRKGKKRVSKKKATFKALAREWKKLSPRGKARYEGKFSAYIKVHREMRITAKTRKPAKRRKTTTKRKRLGRRQPAAVKKQQSKMKAGARAWKKYHGPKDYRAFMSSYLKR